MKSSVKNFVSLFARSLETVDLMENFLIAAVSSVIVIRVYLQLTGYPQIGGGGLHIAHMLWGGLFMLLALVVSLVFLNKESRRSAAILGGVGFGTFIDELGKFITSDNNYFFEPTFALIYIIFIGIFFLVQGIIRFVGVTEKEYAMNALEVMKEVVYYDLDEDEKTLALSYLEKSDPANPVVAALSRLMNTLTSGQVKKDVSLLTRLKRRFIGVYRQWRKGEWLAKWMANAFIALSFVSLFDVALRHTGAWDFWRIGELVGTVGSFVFVLIGVTHHARKRRRKAYTNYRYALLVSILFTEFFRFYSEPVSALIGLTVSLFIYAGIQYLIEQEVLVRLSETA